MDTDLRTKVREVIMRVEAGHIAEAKAGAEELRPLVPAGQPHRGKKNMTEQEIIEWYAGEFLDCVDNGAWFAINSLINCVDKFCPALNTNPENEEAST
jgi:hypothetical protein